MLLAHLILMLYKCNMEKDDLGTVKSKLMNLGI